jgi:hypothetical protein
MAKLFRMDSRRSPGVCAALDALSFSGGADEAVAALLRGLGQSFLFLGGVPPVLETQCIPIVGCV